VSLTITSAINGTVTLTAGDNPVSIASNGSIYGQPVGIYGSVSGTSWIVTNQGSINAQGQAASGPSAGILLKQGGSIANLPNAVINGYGDGVYVYGGAATVTNAGQISGTASSGLSSVGVLLASGGTVSNTANTGTISGVAGGVGFGAPVSLAAGSVSNSGLITSSQGYGVNLAQGGTVTNNQGATIYGFTEGVNVAGGVNLAVNPAVNLGIGSVANYGTIIGHENQAVYLNDGGSVVNGSITDTTASISGGNYGVAINDSNNVNSPNVTGTVTNFGTIIDTDANGTGVEIGSGGTVANMAGALISGGYGVNLDYNNSTLINAGTVTGTGANTIAVQINGTNDRVVVDPGAVFNGIVNGDSGATMELASTTSAGVLAATGDQFPTFSALYIDPGARWTIQGDSTLSSEFAQIGGFAPGDTISLTGLSQTPTTFASSVGTVSGTIQTSVTIEAGSTGLETLTLLGSIASSSFTFVAGTTSTLTETIAPASGTPSISAPAAATVGVGQAGSLGTITIAESPTSGGETFTLALSGSNGVLSANTGAIGGGGTITPSNGGTTLTISNATLAQVNADLTTVTDTDTTTPSDTISYTLGDSNSGTASPASTTVTVNTAPSIAFTTSPFSISQSVSGALSGVSVAETGNTTTSGETFSVVVSDTAGVLAANTGATNGGGSITPSNGGATLTVAGTLLQVNADLSTLTDTDASAAQDTLTVNASDSFGNSATQATDTINVTSAAANIFNAHVYLDTNGDGAQDGSESGLPGVTVNLLNSSGSPTGQSSTTNASGDVSFTSLANGTYEISVVAPSGDVVSQATNTFTNNALSGGQTASATEGVYAPATFSVHVYDDVNADGTQDSGDTNLPGVTVDLLTGSGSPTGKSGTTDSNGNFTFTGLAPGAYQVQVVTPSGDAVTQTINTLTSNTLTSGGSTSATEGVYAPPALTQPTISLTVAEGQSLGNLWTELVANGVDPNPSSLSITAVGTSGTQGTVSLTTGSDSLTYLATGYNPSSPVDAFTYTLTDGGGGTVTGTVDVTVTGANLPTTAPTTPGSTTTATGSGQRLISEGSGQTLVGGTAGGDELFGGPDTTITGRGSGNTIYVEPGNHAITMGANNNTLTLNSGNNTVTATGTGNTVTGGNGNDSVTGMTGTATITLGNGNDTVTVSGAGNNITVGTGTDKITAGNGGNETVVAGDGANTISGGGSGDSFTSGNGASKITATGANATILAGNGGDTITASGAGDQITSGSGNDSINVTVGSATIKAGLGSNTIKFAGSGNEVINQGGTDTLTDNGTNNTIVLPLAGQGQDTINGSVLTNGDTFDLRAALAGTTWDQQLSELSGYLTLGTSGSNTLVQLSVVSGGTPITIAVLNGQGSVSLSSFVAHSLLT
jgi:hypothetical protein